MKKEKNLQTLVTKFEHRNRFNFKNCLKKKKLKKIISFVEGKELLKKKKEEAWYETIFQKYLNIIFLSIFTWVRLCFAEFIHTVFSK